MEHVELSDAKMDSSMPTTHILNQNDPCVSDADGDDDFWCDDISVCDESKEALNIASDLDREWQRRHNQFHTIGYRDGLTAGKEESAQEGFNIGFKQSVLVGYKWGLVRGVTSALSCLPDGMKEKLVEELDTREKFQNLYESVHSVSTQDALSWFHADIVDSKNKEEYGSSDRNENTAYEISTSSPLGRYIEEFESLKLGCSD